MTNPRPFDIILYGPLYARSGFGILARGWAMALHQAGFRVKTVRVDCDDVNLSAGLDDCDLYQLQSLEHTEITAPVVAIFAYVPTYLWPKLPLPQPCRRIMLTTFDSRREASSPPARLVFMCNQMDQVWLANTQETAAWIRAGLAPEKAVALKWPHYWIETPALGQSAVKEPAAAGAFRFLHISLFLPRRRLEALLRAFLEEFADDPQKELYLKMSYPSWHPVPDQPRVDLRRLIADTVKATGSQARVTVDETPGTRMELVRLFDAADAYVSVDTTHTAPVTEAIIRRRPVIISEGWEVACPSQALLVPNSQRLVPITPEMAAYMPHQRDTAFCAVEVPDIRRALRQAVAMPLDERRDRVEGAYEFMRRQYSFEATVPAAVAAMERAWVAESSSATSQTELAGKPTDGPTDDRQSGSAELPSAVSQSCNLLGATPTPSGRLPGNEPAPGGVPRCVTHTLNWCGLQLFHGKLPAVNRAWCRALSERGHALSLVPGNGPFHVEELNLAERDAYRALAERFYQPLPAPAEFTVMSRWHPVFRELPARRQILINTWWTGGIPVDWVRPLQESVDEVWVPSQWVRDNFLNAGIAAERVHVLPFGVDTQLFRPGVSPRPLATRKRFKFLFVGEAGWRKGFDVLLAAYAHAFRGRDDVCLVVKDTDCEDYYVRHGGRQLVEEFARQPNAPALEYLPAMLPEADMPGLYAACDCLVLPLRTASSSLAVLEAMASGVPVIATRHGALLELCTDANAWLVPAREQTRRNSRIGHWTVSAGQRFAEPDTKRLADIMTHVQRGGAKVREKAEQARALVVRQYDWSVCTDRLEARLDVLAGDQRVEPASATGPQTIASGDNMAILPVLSTDEAAGPTVMLVAPLYNRSGYGVAARALVNAWLQAGIRVRVVPVDGVEPGVDDCDLDLIKRLEQTRLTAPLVTVFFHVPSPQWLTVPLPPDALRIMFTTFDSSAQGNHPPAEWISVCNQMDQVWLMSRAELDVFAAAGVARSKLHQVDCPHPWIHNARLPLPAPAGPVPGRPFRFLALAMFLPRRRWDTLIEAYLREFNGQDDVELYLKVNYPSWHPTPDQPQRDLRELIERLRRTTGSAAPIRVDESRDTRLGICRLMDSCDAFVSCDTAITAPVGEVFVREKVAVIPEGYGMNLPMSKSVFAIPVNPRLNRPLTEAELLYQPHHRNQPMPLLVVADVRRALRSAIATPASRRQEMGRDGALFMEWAYGPTAAVTKMMQAVRSGLEAKPGSRPIPAGASGAAVAASGAPVQASDNEAATRTVVAWDGSFLDLGSLSHVNRELTRELARQPQIQLTRLGNIAALNGGAQYPELVAVARELQPVAPPNTQVTVRHAWPPNWTAPASGAWVLIQPWEYGRIPAEWVRNCQRVDEVWVPSACAQRMYVESGVPAEKVHVVPNGINPSIFHPAVPPMPLATRKSFKFLFVGGTIHRKGPDLLLKAYCEHFTAADDVCLVIKDFGGQSVYAGQTFEAQIRAAQARPNAPEILYLTEELGDMAGLYTACDSLVHPYRGEGFGLPVLEAMACGLPVIVTGGGATDDFATDEFAYRVPTKRRAIGDVISGMKLAGEGWLLEPNLPELAAKMRWVFEHRAEARAKGRAASECVRREWTWDRAAQVAAQRLRQITSHQQPFTIGNSSPHPQRKAAPIQLPPAALRGRLGPAHELHRNKKWLPAWESAVDAIGVRPYHPEAFLLLAEIARDVGDIPLAKRCAEQARLLAPKWKPARKFSKSLPGKGGKPRLELPLPSELARDFRHAPRLTVCLITKNEEQFLGQCLESVRPIADQIVVMDTGSTDWTTTIAARFNAEVYSCEWTDDFSVARNAALEHARGDWVLVLDADEELRAQDRDVLKQELQAGGVMAYRLPMLDVGREAEGRSFVPRLFRNAPGLFYVGRIHEQVFSSVEVRRQEWGLDNKFGKATLIHHGYTQAITQQRSKVERNLRLLEKAVEELPDEPNLLLNLGLELVRAGRLPEGLQRYQEAFNAAVALPAAQLTPEIREALLTQFSTQLLKTKEHGAVIQLLTGPLARRGGLTASMHFTLGLALMEQQQFLEAAEQFRQCLAKRQQPAFTPVNQEILKAGPRHCLALCLAQLGHATAAEQFQQAIQDDPQSRLARLDYARFMAGHDQPVEALNLFFALASEHPQEAPVWRQGGQLALSRPEFLEVALNWTGEAQRHLPQDTTICQQRAEALTLAGHCAEALPVWRQLKSAADPGCVAALILCETVVGDNQFSLPAQFEAELSREFITWYRRLLQFNAREPVEALCRRTEALRQILPSAANLLDAAIAEANAAAA